VRLLALATHDVISPVVIASLLALTLVVATALLAGRLRPDDLGLDPDYAGRGIGIVVMIWCAAQVIGVIPRVVANRPVALDPVFEHGSWWDTASGLVAALTAASAGEIAFRGFLLVQVYLLLGKRGTLTRRSILAAACAAFAEIFVAWASAGHWDLTQGMGWALGVTLFYSIFLSWLFFRTRNIFFTIGMHALLLTPTTVVAGPSGGGRWFTPLVIAILATLWALLWPRRD
jgi:membrane protease YdiL (CAAX protease family)